MVKKIEKLVHEVLDTLDTVIEGIQDREKLSDKDFGLMIGAVSAAVLQSYLEGFDPEVRMVFLDQVINHVKQHTHLDVS